MSIFEQTQQKKSSDSKTTTVPLLFTRGENVDANGFIGTGDTMDMRWASLYGNLKQGTRSDEWTSTEFQVHDENIATLTSLVVELMHKVDEMTREIASLKDALLLERKERLAEQPHAPFSSARSLLPHVGKWEGSDSKQCLELVYATRSEAEF